MSITAYMSTNDTSLAFERVLNTGSGSGLPAGSFQERFNDGRSNGKILHMPREGGSQRIGAFNCIRDINGRRETIPTIVMARNSLVTPTSVSKTVSIGESATFEMIAPSSTNLYWKRNGANIDKWTHRKTARIANVTLDDAGIYECYNSNGRLNQGLHAIFQLVVRGCANGRWGEECQSLCPMCYNGGICNERSGQCVCAPGFAGDQCTTAVGRNRFGVDGMLQCSDDDTGCKGKLFCLPHPYGCSCAAGYKGLDCREECEHGRYGASCRSECHCADNVTCLADTGQCEQCHPDWYGTNCQDRCPDTRPVTNLRGTATRNTISVHWDPFPTPCSELIDYEIRYQHLNQDQCDGETGMEILAAVTNSTQVSISDLYFSSTYRVIVTTRSNMRRESQAAFTNITTEEAGSVIIALRAIPNGNTLVVKWVPEPRVCARHVEYKVVYELQDRDQCMAKADGALVRSHVFTNLTETSFEDLFYHSTYRVYLTTKYKNGREVSMDAVTKTTDQAVPSAPPSDVTASDVSSNHVSLQWAKPPCGYRHGSILSYLYRLKYANETIIVANTTKTTDVTIGSLSPSTTYRFTLTASTQSGEGPGYTMSIQTKETVPSAPRTLRAYNVTKTSIAIAWEVPQHTNGILRKYVVQNRVVSRPYDPHFSAGSEHTDYRTIYDMESTHYILQGLVPSTEYEIKVSGYTTTGKGEEGVIRVFTLPVSEEDLPIPKYLPIIKEDQITPTDVSIVIPSIDSELITGYLIGVRLKTSTHHHRRHTLQFYHYEDNHEAYIAGDLASHLVKKNVTFVIGDGHTYGIYANPPLAAGATYGLYTAVYSTTNETIDIVSWSEGTDVTLPFDIPRDVRMKSNSLTVMITVAVIAFIMVIAVVAKLFIKNRSLKKQLYHTGNDITLLESRVLPHVPGCSDIQMSDYTYELQMAAVMGHREDGVKVEDIYHDVASVTNTIDLSNERNDGSHVSIHGNETKSESASDFYDDVSVKSKS